MLERNMTKERQLSDFSFIPIDPLRKKKKIHVYIPQCVFGLWVRRKQMAVQPERFFFILLAKISVKI